MKRKVKGKEHIKVLHPALNFKFDSSKPNLVWGKIKKKLKEIIHARLFGLKITSIKCCTQIEVLEPLNAIYYW